MTKQVKEIYTDLSGKTTVEYSDDSVRIIDQIDAGFPAALTAGIPYTGTVVLADPTANETGAPKFAFAFAGGEFRNHPTTNPYVDHVAFLGYNFKQNGVQNDASLPAGGLGWESKYTQGGADFAQEFYYRCLSADGSERRPFGFYLPYNNLEGSSGDVRVESYVFGYHQRGALTLIDRIKWDLYQGLYDVKSGVFRFEANNIAQFQQRNAANSAYLKMPYIDASNDIVSPDAPYGMPDASNPLVIRGKSGISGNEIVAVKDSSGNTLFRVGGVPGNTTGLGAGWFGVETSHANGAGFELKSTASAARTFTAQLEGNGNLIMRQNTGAGQWYMDVYGTLNVRDWANGAASLLTLNGTKAAFNQPVGLRSYADVAALPSASGAGAGALAYVASTTTPGGACVVCSDGSVWKVVVQLSGAVTVA